MAILYLTPTDWCAGLHQTSRQLRAAWAQAWHGLPTVLDECLTSLGLQASDNADISALNRFARGVGSDMEALARDGNADAIAHMSVWRKLKEVTDEMDSRQRWHGSMKPISKRA
jgi:hypothetical protein